MSDASTHSRDKVRRFVEFFLSLKQPDFFFHQTLTFAEEIHDAAQAKARLKKLLEREFFRGVIYAQERHGSGGVHFHVLLYFYAEHELPFARSKMKERLATEVFAAWNEINGGNLKPEGNVLQKYDKPDYKSVLYLTKQALHCGTRDKGETNWWGKRNANFLIKSSEPLDKKKVKEWMKRLYPRTPLPVGLRFTKRNFLRDKNAYLEVSLAPEQDWERLKQREMRSITPVSDDEYFAYLKMQADKKRKAYSGSNRIRTSGG